MIEDFSFFYWSRYDGDCWLPTQYPNFVGSHNMSSYKEKEEQKEEQEEQEEKEEEKEKKDEEEMREETAFPRLPWL